MLPGGGLLPDPASSVSLLQRTRPACFNEEHWQSAGRRETIFSLSVMSFGLASFMHKLVSWLSTRAVTGHTYSETVIPCTFLLLTDWIPACPVSLDCFSLPLPPVVPVNSKTCWVLLLFYPRWINSSIQFPVSFTERSTGTPGKTVEGNREIGAKKSDRRQETSPAGFVV